jgi:hypothetical protein
MGLLDDMLKALDGWDEWKKMRTAPAELEALRERVAQLEEKLSGKYPAEVCRKCWFPAMSLRSTYGPDKFGSMIEDWHCGRCDGSEERRVKPRERD